MTTILYTDREGGYWQPIKLDLTIEEIENQCLLQKLDEVDSYHKTRLVAGNGIFIDAAAVMFPDGRIWDSILSDYDKTPSVEFDRILEMRKDMI